MKFGPVDVRVAHGAILAHAIETGDGRLKKGKKITADDILSLQISGVEQIICVRLEADDVEENDAARMIASALISHEVVAETAFTGRVNLFVKSGGLLKLNVDLINQINQIDPGITIATLPQFSPIEEGRMVATVKIIPFAVRLMHVEKAKELAANSGALELKPFQSKRIGLIATKLPSLKTKTMDKTRRILDQRLALSNSHIVEELRVGHNADDIADAIAALKDRCDMLILFGASAITDIDDVIPSGLRNAGGEVDHFGMPVDPGNLLLLGHLGDLDIIGAPGCARSPRENGFDWILQRLLADVAVSKSEIEGMGVGGLLMEIHSRPQPRQPVIKNDKNIYVLVLAAGQSRRMGNTNKLLAEIKNKSLVRQAVETSLESQASAVIVVTGFEADRVKSALDGLNVEFAHNENFASGLASSLKCGVAALPQDCSGVLVMLADMPHIKVAMIDEMIEAFRDGSSAAIVQAASQGKRGNPVLWAAQYFEALCGISGDVGARHLLGEYSDNVIEVELGDAAALDIDTPAELITQGGSFKGED